MTVESDLLKSVLKLTFESNMVFLKAEFPHLYEKFVNYEPKEYGLELDQNGNLNIACNGHYIYEGNPKETVLAQVEHFLRNPLRNIYRLSPLTEDEIKKKNPMGFRHVEYLAQVSSVGGAYEGKALKEDLHRNSLGRFPFLTVTGTGLGYHLERLAQENIDCLYIYEPNEDLFYASLFTINWEWLVNVYTQDNRTITLLVGVNKERFFEGFAQLFFRFGTFRSGAMAFFNHYSSETADDIWDYVKKNSKILYSGFGFMEDEIMSLEHSYQNIKRKNKYLAKRFDLKAEGADYPLFICGSGPSMDFQWEYIKKYQEKAIIVSCGTGLTTLFNYGIKPDVHIEIERTKITYDWLSSINEQDPEFLKDIFFLTMNNAYPKVPELFDESLCFLKPNDAGTEMIRVTYENGLPLMFGTNPTCVNGALAFFNQLGSGDMYLFGTDFGYKDNKNHHSKNSGYFSKFKQYDTGFAKGAEREGNFGGKVYTDHIFDACRASVEYSIRNHVKDEEKRIYNCSDGAKVIGTEPLWPKEIELGDDINKQLFFDILRSEKVCTELDSEIWKDQITDRLKETISFIDDILIRREYLTADFEPAQIIDIFNTVQTHLMKSDNTKQIVSYRILKGSIVYMQTCITGYVYLIGNNEYCKSFIKAALSIMFDYYEELKELLIKSAGEMGADVTALK